MNHAAAARILGIALALPALATVAVGDDQAPGSPAKGGDKTTTRSPTQPPKGAKKTGDSNDPATNAKLQLKLDPEDRKAVEGNLAYTLAEIPTTGVEWIGSSPLTGEALHGRVIVIQSLTTKGNWKNGVEALRRQLKDASEAPVVILLHTPEGADKARKILEPALGGWIGVIDSEGAWCDELGVWKRPVNLVVDRDGIVRYAGLTPEGVRAAVEILSEMKASQDPEKKARPAQTSEIVKFPNFREPVGAARDQRGKEMPEFVVDSWYSNQPSPNGRVVVIDFWATWCGPCRQGIPHVNELASQFENDACFVGLSNETRGKFEEGLAKHRLDKKDFRYALGLDPQSRLSSFFAVSAIPYCVVVSSDNIVRWQGSPRSLTAETLQPIIAANRQLASSGAGPAPGRSWKDGGAEKSERGRSAPPRRKGY